MKSLFSFALLAIFGDVSAHAAVTERFYCVASESRGGFRFEQYVDTYYGILRAKSSDSYFGSDESFTETGPFAKQVAGKVGSYVAQTEEGISIEVKIDFASEATLQTKLWEQSRVHRGSIRWGKSTKRAVCEYLNF